jgi:hypothetical protein
VRGYLYLATKKCRIYAAFGVSQTPIYTVIRGRSLNGKNIDGKACGMEK